MRYGISFLESNNIINNLNINIKMTYQDNIMSLISFIEINQNKVWENHKNLPLNATIKVVVKELIEQSGLVYTRPLGSFVRGIVTFPNTDKYSIYKRTLIGLSIEEAVFGITVD